MARKMKTMDGNNAAAYASYAFTDVAAIYPRPVLRALSTVLCPQAL